MRAMSEKTCTLRPRTDIREKFEFTGVGYV